MVHDIIRRKEREGMTMRNSFSVLFVLVLVLTGCEYSVPLAEKKDVPIDETILGLWEQVPDKSESGKPADMMLVLKYTDTDYIVHYPTGKDGMYFRAYPLKIDGKVHVQTQFIGTKDGPVENKDRKFHVVAYSVAGGIMEMRLLNSDLVDKNLQDSAKLMESFLKNKDDKNLFKDPGRFKKISR